MFRGLKLLNLGLLEGKCRFLGLSNCSLRLFLPLLDAEASFSESISNNEEAKFIGGTIYDIYELRLLKSF